MPIHWYVFIYWYIHPTTTDLLKFNLFTLNK